MAEMKVGVGRKSLVFDYVDLGEVHCMKYEPFQKVGSSTVVLNQNNPQIGLHLENSHIRFLHAVESSNVLLHQTCPPNYPLGLPGYVDSVAHQNNFPGWTVRLASSHHHQVNFQPKLQQVLQHHHSNAQCSSHDQKTNRLPRMN